MGWCLFRYCSRSRSKHNLNLYLRDHDGAIKNATKNIDNIKLISSQLDPFIPRLTGVSAERHWPGGGGGAYNAPPG